MISSSNVWFLIQESNFSWKWVLRNLWFHENSNSFIEKMRDFFSLALSPLKNFSWKRLSKFRKNSFHVSFAKNAVLRSSANSALWIVCLKIFVPILNLMIICSFAEVANLQFTRLCSKRCLHQRLFSSKVPLNCLKTTFPTRLLYNFLFGIFPDNWTFSTLLSMQRPFLEAAELSCLS